MIRGKIKHDNLTYGEFVQILTGLSKYEELLHTLMEKVEAFMPDTHDHFRFKIRPYSKALRVTVLRYPMTGDQETDVASRFRLRYEQCQKEVMLSGEIAAEPEGTDLPVYH